MAGEIKGSPLFMSPEQVNAEDEIDGRSDIYSLGVSAFQLLTGSAPFTGKKKMEIMIAHARDPAPRPTEIEPSVPADLESVIMKCLEKKPENRFQNVEALDAALAACERAGHWSKQDGDQWWHANETKWATE